MPATLASLADVSTAVAATSSRNAKIARLADLLRTLSADEAALAVRYLTGAAPQGKIGVGYALLHRALAAPPAVAATLTLAEVDAALTTIAATSGPGSGKTREATLGALVARATAPERDLLAGLLTGALRQGALEGVMVVAIARASGVDEARVRRAFMLSGALAATARAALASGASALAGFDLTVFRPVLPMLAQVADGVDEALAALADPVLEHKLDGARVQLHKDGDQVRIYARGGGEVTAAVPELHAFGLALPGRRVILDGEALALRPDGRPWPFQITMRRFGRTADDPAVRAELPLTARWFDCLLVDDDVLLDRAGRDRAAALAALAPADAIIPRLVTRDPAAAAGFLAAAFAAGHEGVMAKDLDAPYQAGNRGSAWLKIKKVHTLDLVVLAVEWGSGRRKGLLSNIHLGARAPDGWVMLGKTFKGMTDAMLAWQTQEFLARQTARDGHVVHVRPEVVAEIAFSDVQVSHQYPGGLALRLARVVRYRPDKAAAEAATLAEVRAIAIADGALDPSGL